VQSTTPGAVIPVSTATNMPGEPIPVRYGIPEYIAVAP